MQQNKNTTKDKGVLGMKANNETCFELSGEFYSFTVVQNYILEDARITDNAIGLYMRIVKFQNSKEHKIYLSGLITETNTRRKVTNAMSELMEHGYIKREPIRNDKGQFKGYKYMVFSKPCDTSVSTECTKTDFGKTEFGEVTTKKENVSKKKIDKKENKDDDKKQSSIIINNTLIESFSQTWKERTGKGILLTIKQKEKIQYLINEYGYDTALSILDKVKESKYLTSNMTISHFVDHDTFVKIANDTYKDRVEKNDKKNNFDNLGECRREFDYDMLDKGDFLR